MAHEVETMAYANAVPWHGLGAKVDDSLTPAEFLKAAGLDWTVDKFPLTATMNGEAVEIPGRYALLRSTDKKVMGITGETWTPNQNSATIDFMRNYVAAGGAKLETAGSLNGGKFVWGLAKLAHSFKMGPKDDVEGYLLITSPHAVGHAITIRTTTVRVVCANTMAYANRSGKGETHYRQNHLNEFNVEAAKEAVGLAHEQLAAIEANAKIIQKLKITAEDTVRKVLLPVFLPDFEAKDDVMKRIMDVDVMPKKVAQILESIEQSPGAQPDNGWGVLNGVTHYCDHVQGRAADTRMFRSWCGDYNRLKNETKERLLDLAA